MRWGLPGPPQFGGAPVTNIRNVISPHWRSVLGVAHRCPLIRAMIKVLRPKIRGRINAGAADSAGFLCEAHDFLRPQAKNTA